MSCFLCLSYCTVLWQCMYMSCEGHGNLCLAIVPCDYTFPWAPLCYQSPVAMRKGHWNCYDENKIPDQIFAGGESRNLRLDLQGGLFQRWEPEIPEAGVCASKGCWGVAAASVESLTRRRASLVWNGHLWSRACSICPQLLMITCPGLSTWCCPHEPLVSCQAVCMFLVLILLHPCWVPSALILHIVAHAMHV